MTARKVLYEDRDEDMTVFIETDDVELAAQALEAATPRLSLVTFGGQEFETFEAWEAAVEENGDNFEIWNANFVFDVERRRTGAFVVLDTKGGTTGAMGRTVVRIVVEELRRKGVTTARLRPVTGSDHDVIT